MLACCSTPHLLPPTTTQDYPVWNFDGSSTGQAPGHDSEVYMVARSVFKDPFRGGDNLMVMCDTYEPPRLLPDGTVTPMIALPTNTRAACAEVGTWQGIILTVT